ncbi:MAG: ABC transporter permease [Thermoplasmatota archaeon]|nr:ABC transporter permease [Candidatus Thermoplasmatota archaeon]MBU1914285.1 ABC transporter permease [Candidatus Thermoplasmatota archaeon]
MSESWIIQNLRAVRGRAYPRILGAQREPSWIFFDVVLPLLGVAAYVYVYKFMNAPSEFVGFVILGGAMAAFWLNILWSMASQLYWEKETGNLSLYLIAPVSRLSILAGMAVGGLFFTTLRASSTLIIGIVVFNVTLSLSSPIMLIAVFTVTMIALYGMGMMFASLYLLFGREAYHLSSLMTEPIYLASGLYFPVKALGYWAAAGASIIPITLGLDGLRQLFYPSTSAEYGFLPVELELVILAGLSVLFLFLSKLSLDYMEKLGKTTGRLTLRWQ